MKLLTRLLCNFLIVSMVWLPFAAQAGLVGTGQVIAGAANQANADKVQEFVARTDVQTQLAALGVDPATAQERVAAMTQEEINRIAGNIDSLPAGATDSWVWWTLGIIVVGGILWYMYK
jgi:hypothetical protein